MDALLEAQNLEGSNYFAQKSIERIIKDLSEKHATS